MAEEIQMDNQEESNLSNDHGTVVVGEGVRLEGRIDNAKDTQISGTYSGTVKSDSISVTDNGNLNGDIRAGDATISGKFDGDIKVDKGLLVNSSGKVKGNIEYSFLEVKFGATVEGMIKHSGSVSSISSNLENSNNTEMNSLNDSSDEEIN